MRSPVIRGCVYLLLAAMIAVAGCATKGSAEYYDLDKDLDAITRQMEAWCITEKEDTVVFSVLSYGHPHCPSAIRVVFEKRRDEAVDLLSPGRHEAGEVTWREAWYDLKKEGYRIEEGSRKLTRQEAEALSTLIERSELFRLPPMVDGQDFTILDPLVYVFHLVEAGKIKVVRRTSTQSLPAEVVLGRLNEMTRKTNPVTPATPATGVSAGGGSRGR